ncbi:MAG TPA: hypothetical protein VIJ84_00730, partial [Gaiellaceae bacterium]
MVAVVVLDVVVVVLDVADVAVVAVTPAHVAFVMVFVSSVTAPLRASNRPSIVAPVVAVMDVRARTLPRKVEPVPSVAELPIC